MFDSLRGMAGMAGLMKDLPRIKAKFQEVKAELATQEVTATSGGGAVTAIANGKLRIVRLEFDPAMLGALVEASDAESSAFAANLITEACNAALDSAQTMIADAIALAADELGLDLPQGALENLTGI